MANRLYIYLIERVTDVYAFKERKVVPEQRHAGWPRAQKLLYAENTFTETQVRISRGAYLFSLRQRQ